jgi:phosphatidylglycerophosphatase A
MMSFAKLIATFFGIGYIEKGAGTIAALLFCVIWYFSGFYHLGVVLQLAFILIIFFLGVVVSKIVEPDWGHDSNRIVFDEVLGMSVALFLIAPDWKFILAAFILFRFFDIVKPLFIRKAEHFPSGWGVMSDDLLAGIYTNVILQIVIKSHLF